MDLKPDQPAIDLQGLIDSGLEGMLPELIAIFLETAPGTIEKARIALRDARGAEIAQAAHSLAGSCGNFGAISLNRLCKELENVGHSKSLQAASGLMESVEKEFVRVRSELLSYLERT
jgi:HPt (histidine-containing phosphotransfer) domain-containing protein